METMEKLYNQGYLSYPRTETNKYTKSINLKGLVKKQKDGPWSAHVSQMLDGSMWKGPRNGNKDDRAHPPIHPVKLAKQEDLKPREW